MIRVTMTNDPDGDGDGVSQLDPCPFDNPDDSDGDGSCDSVDLHGLRRRERWRRRRDPRRLRSTGLRGWCCRPRGWRAVRTVERQRCVPHDVRRPRRVHDRRADGELVQLQRGLLTTRPPACMSMACAEPPAAFHRSPTASATASRASTIAIIGSAGQISPADPISAGRSRSSVSTTPR